MENFSKNYSKFSRDCSISELFEILKELVNSVLHNLFQNIGEKNHGKQSNLLHESRIILTAKSDKHYKKMLNTDLFYKYRFTNESIFGNVYAWHLLATQLMASTSLKKARVSEWISSASWPHIYTFDSHMNLSSPHFHFRGEKKSFLCAKIKASNYALDPNLQANKDPCSVSYFFLTFS